ncbi:MAG: tetratricopeptide repeat protein, partial [Verrucomicrobiota bacterium]|nr:tetratricopeptide repeat protein [Verrucomicrobiota bacterium]
IGRPDEAVAEYETALEIRPDYLAAHKNISAALDRLGRYTEALEHMQLAWQIEARKAETTPSPTP